MPGTVVMALRPALQQTHRPCGKDCSSHRDTPKYLGSAGRESQKADQGSGSSSTYII